MALITVNPTSNTTPDAGQGGLAVSSATNTGHGNTAISVSNGATQTKSCIWTTFQSVAGQIVSIRLKADWSVNGLLEAAGTNEFRFQYSLDGGSNWTTTVIRGDVVAADSGSVDVALSATQNIAQVQMRDRLTATADSGIGVDAQINATISNIKLEVTTVDASLLVMM